MNDVLNQLLRLLLESVPTVVFVLILFFLLDRLLFRPVMGVLKERGDATAGAVARAREQAATAEAKMREYDAAFQAARQEVYRLRDTERRAGLSERESSLQKAREQAEAMVREAQANLSAEVGTARGQLDAACRMLAEEISSSILGLSPKEGSGPPTGQAGGAQS